MSSESEGVLTGLLSQPLVPIGNTALGVSGAFLKVYSEEWRRFTGGGSSVVLRSATSCGTLLPGRYTLRKALLYRGFPPCGLNPGAKINSSEFKWSVAGNLVTVT